MKVLKSIPSTSLIFLLVMFLIGMGLEGCKSKSNFSELTYHPNQVREEIRLLVDSVKKDNYIGTEQMGRLPIAAPAYLRRQALMRKAYDAELINLTLHPNPVVSLVAFEGLYERDEKTVPVIFERISERPDMLHYIRGDISMRIPMVEYAYVYVMRFALPGEEIPTQLEPGGPKYELSDQTHTKVVQKIAALRPLE
jgi:hypothetical protein